MTKKSNKPVRAPSTPQGSSNRPLQTQVTQTAFAGPLPHPAILEQYNKVAPGFSERIVAIAEYEAEHRHAMEQRALGADIANLRARNRETHIGQFLGFFIAVLTIGCGTYTVTHGAEIAGGLIGTGGVASLVTVFIYGRKAN